MKIIVRQRRIWWCLSFFHPIYIWWHWTFIWDHIRWNEAQFDIVEGFSGPVVMKRFHWKMIFNSHAVDMAVAQSLGFEIDFVRNPISGSAAWYFIIILEIIFSAILEIKVHVKKFCGQHKNSRQRGSFEPRFFPW